MSVSPHSKKSWQSQKVFTELYKKLNPRQKEAVDAIDGPLMIIAGPGTGKTQILSLRIANILRLTDTTPDSILALTFTESAAHAMRRRLVDIIGSAAYRVNTTTFHSFCNNIIRDFPDEFPRIIGSRAVGDIKQIDIIEQILAAHTFDLLKPYGDPSYYVLPSLRIIRSLKRENVSPATLEKLIAEQEKEVKNAPDREHTSGARKGETKVAYKELDKQVEKNKELVKVYELYEKALRDEHLYDYEDMILEVIRTLETNNDLLLRLGENYQFILADEHQDANAAQNRILELLASASPDDNPNICVVGDEKQAIFRFQGASLENFMGFKKRFPKARVVSLEENYRSRQDILDAAHSLIAKNNVADKALQVRLKASGEHVQVKKMPALYLREFSEERLEHIFIARDIEQKIRDGVSPRSIAIIYRENRDVFPIMSALERTNVPFVVRSDQNVLGDMNVRKLITLFKAVLNPGQDDLIGHILYFDFLGIDQLDAYHVTTEARSRHEPILRTLETVASGNGGGKSRGKGGSRGKDTRNIFKNPAALADLGQNIKMWSKIARNSSATEAFETIARESGFISYLLSQPAGSSLFLKIDALFREAEKLIETKRTATLADFATYVDMLDDYDVLVRADQTGAFDDAVELMTAHKSKGLEFEYVYIVGAADKHWGNKRQQQLFKIPLTGFSKSADTSDSTEDERRLFYVAITRAKQAVYISFARRDAEGRERLPSQFVEEIDPGLLEREPVADVEKDLSKETRVAIHKKTEHSRGVLDQKFISSHFIEQGLSVTALNNYLTCPWRYFFLNLIRLPRPRSAPQLYGIAVHEALKFYFNRIAEGEKASKKYLLETFERMLARQPLTDEEFGMMKHRGLGALGGYFDAFSTEWPRETISEYNIAGVFVDVEMDAVGEPGKKERLKILLRGTLDKLEFVSADNVHVVDYKTRQPQSRNEIMGLTKHATGDYFRQLVFYKLLLDGHHDEAGHRKYTMESGEISYIEPNEKGQYKRETFIIAPEDTKKLTDTIQAVSRDIYTFAFADSECDDTKCEFCDLVRMLKAVKN